MIQRIQTLYLLGIVLLSGGLLFSPLSTLLTPNEELTFYACGVYKMLPCKELIYPTWGLFAVGGIIGMVSLITIFLYKKRILQIRMSVFNGCLMVGFYLLFALFAWIVRERFNAELFLSFPLSFPLIAFILNYLTIRGIASDEALVRSLDRIR